MATPPARWLRRLNHFVSGMSTSFVPACWFRLVWRASSVDFSSKSGPMPNQHKPPRKSITLSRHRHIYHASPMQPPSRTNWRQRRKSAGSRAWTTSIPSNTWSDSMTRHYTALGIDLCSLDLGSGRLATFFLTVWKNSGNGGKAGVSRVGDPSNGQMNN